MGSKMSTKYLLTVVADLSQDLNNLLKELKGQDRECKLWREENLDELEKLLTALKGNAENRRSELIRAKGANPEDYPF